MREPPKLAVWGGAAALMLLPVLAMRAVEGGPSEPGDFIFMGVLLAGVGLGYELAARVTSRRAYPAGAGAALLAALLLTWINLAVGIIGSEDDPANWMFGGVLVTAMVGAGLARFRARGLARAMLAAAAAQVLVFVGALAGGFGFTGPITVFFTALWLISAWLFQKAARGG